MLGSLARKLRIIGYDTLYLRDVQDKELIDEARRTGRILLTSDKMLYSSAKNKNLPSLLLLGKSDSKRLLEIRRWLESNKLSVRTETTRCAICNTELTKVSKKDVSSFLPENVFKRHREFFFCNKCKKVYWRGNHWKRLRKLIYSFEKG